MLDNFNSYYDVRLKEARAANLTALGIKVVHGDVCDDQLLARLFATYTFDAVAHLAAQAGVRYSIDHPLEYVRNNIECFVRLLEHLRLRPAIRFVYASSSSVYGSQVRVPMCMCVFVCVCVCACTCWVSLLIFYTFVLSFRSILSFFLSFFGMVGAHSVCIGRPGRPPDVIVWRVQALQ